MSAIRYGVFQFGMVWTIMDDRGARIGFPSREVALAAIAAMVAVHRGSMETVLVTVQDERGGLRTILNPLDDAALEIANDESWNLLPGAQPITAPWRDQATTAPDED